MQITDDIKVIKGIGEKKAKLFNKLGIYSIEDLLYYFPRAYKDKSKMSSVKDVLIGEYCTIKARLLSRPIESRSRNGLLITKAVLVDESGKITALWYNNRYIKDMLKTSCEYVFYGKVSMQSSDKIIETPEFEVLRESESINLLRIVPEYSLTDGLSGKDIRKAIYNVLESIENKAIDIFSDEFRKELCLAEINFSFKNIHFPEDNYKLDIARHRFKFEELFIIQYGLAKLKELNDSSNGLQFEYKEEINNIINSLPFSLTSSQTKVLDEVFKDMCSSKAMNRLIQGDVGSGKTVIAILALYLCVLNGYQGLMMVPTEILADQHYSTAIEMLRNTEVSIEILKGNMSAKGKTDTLKRLKEGNIDIIIGTHALIEDKVEFHNLGLVITDEQHRFGVKQRALLSDKGNNPNMLVMTATPIPRTLTIILYGDLDISIIDEKPIGRRKIETYFIDSTKKDRLFNFVKKQINEGRQVYIVCPLVEESDKLELNSAVEYYAEMKNEHFRDYKVGLLHGKMKAKEKDNIMEQFRSGNIDVLVSTTVIEVGVNVPNATIMIIENADRFGLAQLHQLRGRVGRGELQSYCILISDSKGKEARERLDYLTKSDDGFDIADMDLKIRGGGEILGLRQHGAIQFKLVDILNDGDIIRSSKKAVEKVLKNENSIKNTFMKKEIEQRLAKILDNIVLN